MLLSKNLLFSTLIYQITNDFVWKAQVKHNSFTFNFVKLLYLIFWDARTNLIRFFWNPHHTEQLLWIREQFFVHHNIPKSSGWIPRSNNVMALQVEKNVLGTQAAVSLMVLSKNLLLSTLGSQIAKDFVWKSKVAIHSFTFNFVKLLYLIIWEARTNLIIFFWNLHHIEHLAWISEQFLPITIFKNPQGWFPGQIMLWLCKLKKNILGSQAAVSLTMSNKNLLFSTLAFQITIEFVWKSKAVNPFIQLKFYFLTFFIYLKKSFFHDTWFSINQWISLGHTNW